MREYIWLPETEIAPTMQSRTQVDRPVAVVDGVNTGTPATLMVHVDHLNRPVRMTNSTKASVWDVIYTPWGAFHSATGAQTLNARFPGQWFQLESGLHYNWHRHYDPSLGRYTQPDPLGFVDGPSVFAYAGNSPVIGVDPDGRMLPGGPMGPLIITTVFRKPPPPITEQCDLGDNSNGGSAASGAGAPPPPNTPPVVQVNCSKIPHQQTEGPANPLSGCGLGDGGGRGGGSGAGASGSNGPPTVVIGRTPDLKNLGPNEQSLIDRLPNLGSPKANWEQNAGVLRQIMKEGRPIRDASPGDTGGPFLNAERNLLRDRGWTYDAKSSFWNPPR